MKRGKKKIKRERSKKRMKEKKTLTDKEGHAEKNTNKD